MESQIWILWVDNEIWGHTTTLDAAKWFLNKIVGDITGELQKESPHWIVNNVAVGDNLVKIKCTNPGYLYNSKWTAHTVRYEPVFKLLNDASPMKKRRCFELIASAERNSNPETRPPTPTATPTPAVTPDPAPLVATIVGSIVGSVVGSVVESVVTPIIGSNEPIESVRVHRNPRRNNHKRRYIKKVDQNKV